MRYVENIEHKVWTFIQQHHMLSPGDGVVAGVSGGADSVCLLFLLLKWRERLPISIQVVHVDHGIRKEAGEDAAYVEELCCRYRIPFTLLHENVRERAMQEKRSEEEMGRNIRYEAFARAAKSMKTENVKIAVAHNSNDQAETMLFHLLRGSGLTGLCGIKPVRGQIIRPILCLERQEIERYLTERGITWRKDITNEEDDYTRNRIRHHILPYAEREIVHGCVSHMAQTALMLGETEDFLERLTQEAYDRLVQAGASDISVDCEGYRKVDPVIGRRLIYRLLKELSPGWKDISHVHVQDVAALLEREGNRSISLPHGLTVRRQYGEVLFIQKSRGERAAAEVWAVEELAVGEQAAEGAEMTEDSLKRKMEITLDLQKLLCGITTVETAEGESLYFQVFSQEKNQDIPQNRYTKWFDYDKMKEPLTVRTRKTGDFLSIKGPGEGKQLHKPVKEYMVNEKIPRQERDRLPVLAQGSHILWIVGYRISEYFKISENTKRILQVQLRRGCECSEMEEKDDRTC